MSTDRPSDEPDSLLFWGRYPLATTLWLRERLRAYREIGDPSQETAPEGGPNDAC